MEWNRMDVKQKKHSVRQRMFLLGSGTFWESWKNWEGRKNGKRGGLFIRIGIEKNCRGEGKGNEKTKYNII